MNQNHASHLHLAPWFHLDAILDDGLAFAYADGFDTISGAFPRAFTTFWDKPHRTAVPRHHLRRNSGETYAAAQTALARMASQRQGSASFDVLVPTEFGLDLSHFRIRGEVEYGENLSHLRTLGWRNVPAA